MALEIPLVKLNSGSHMPVLGFGTASDGAVGGDQLTQVILDAIKAGYRHFDTAAVYGTEVQLGQAIAEAIQCGILRGREEVFVTSKLWCADADHDLVLPAIKNSLRSLGLEYLDLYLIHWPVRTKKEQTGIPVRAENILPLDMRSTWAAMEECQRLGLARTIGVSNFSSKKLSQLLLHATIPPAVNQVEMNPLRDQRRLRTFCEEKGIHVVAWAPLGANGTLWGSPAVLETPLLKEIAEAKGKSVAQVALRWVHEQGVSVLVKSFNSERMRENMRIFDWELSEEEREKIKQIPQKRGFMGNMFLSPNGPYKTAEELWDGEI